MLAVGGETALVHEQFQNDISLGHKGRGRLEHGHDVGIALREPHGGGGRCSRVVAWLVVPVVVCCDDDQRMSLHDVVSFSFFFGSCFMQFFFFLTRFRLMPSRCFSFTSILACFTHSLLISTPHFSQTTALSPSPHISLRLAMPLSALPLLLLLLLLPPLPRLHPLPRIYVLDDGFPKGGLAVFLAGRALRGSCSGG